MSRRLALISEHASPLGVLGGVDSGGQNVYVGHVARELATRGWEVDVFTRREHELQAPVAEWVDRVRIIHVAAGPVKQVPKEQLLPLMPTFARATMRYCAQRDYALVHANFWMSGLVAAEIKRELGIPFVITFHALGRVRRLHQGVADTFPNERLDIEDRLVREADRIVAECPQDISDLTDLYGADPRRIVMIPCGFDPAEFWPIDTTLARTALELPVKQHYVLQLGRMVPRKGVDTAIRAMAELRRRHDLSAKLLIVGGESIDPNPTLTPEIGRLQAVAEAEGVADQVQFLGRRDRESLKYYYSAADAFVTTPWYEPFGITPLEAMACGTPVIGSDVGGIKYSVRDGETGYLVPAKDPVSVADRLSELLRCPQRTRAMGRAAIRRVNDHFTWRHVVDALTGVYEEVMIKRTPARIATQDDIAQAFDGLIDVLRDSKRSLREPLIEAAELIARCFASSGKILVCGNGGSAADAQHFAAELVGRFKRSERPALPVIALTADTATLTAWANDVGYSDVFARQIEAFGRPGDIAVGISTSGRSANVVRALQTARRRGLHTVGLLGGSGGEARPLANVALIVPSTDTQHIQETHLVLLHTLCDLVEQRMLAATAPGPNGGAVKDAGRLRRGGTLKPSHTLVANGSSRD